MRPSRSLSIRRSARRVVRKAADRFVASTWSQSSSSSCGDRPSARCPRCSPARARVRAAPRHDRRAPSPRRLVPDRPGRKRAAARVLDLLRNALGALAVGAVVDGHWETVLGQPARDRGADAARGAGDERSCRSRPLDHPAPQVKPAPKAARSTVAPARGPRSRASARASGIVADDDVAVAVDAIDDPRGRGPAARPRQRGCGRWPGGRRKGRCRRGRRPPGRRPGVCSRRGGAPPRGRCRPCIRISRSSWLARIASAPPPSRGAAPGQRSRRCSLAPPRRRRRRRRTERRADRTDRAGGSARRRRSRTRSRNDSSGRPPSPSWKPVQAAPTSRAPARSRSQLVRHERRVGAQLVQAHGGHENEVELAGLEPGVRQGPPSGVSGEAVEALPSPTWRRSRTPCGRLSSPR